MRQVLWLAVLVSLPARVDAQRYAFRQYGPAEGLANQVIRTMAQDRQGFLWVGTENGLYRYDGARFVRFGTEHGIQGRRITSIHQSPDGLLWVGTCNGIYARQSPNRFVEVNLGVPGDDLGCSSIASTAGGTVYIDSFAGLHAAAPRTGGGYVYRTLHRSLTGSSEETPFGIQVQGDGSVLFGSESGLYRYARGRVEKVGAEAGVPADRWKAILAAGDGSTWIRSAHRLLVRPRGAAQFLPVQGPQLQSSDYVSLAADREGDVFVPSDFGLWLRDARGRWRHVTMKQGLPMNGTSYTFQDHEASVWIGMQGAGLARWLGFGEWESWTSSDGLPDDGIWQMKRDRAGALWVGTNLGLASLGPGGSWRNWRIPANGGNVVRGVEVAGDNAVWAGFGPGGLFRLDPRSGAARRFGDADGLRADYILALSLDATNTLWVGAQGGLYKASRPGPAARFEKVDVPGTDSTEVFRRCLRDRKGRVWAPGTHGLCLLEDGRWTRFTTTDGLRENKVGYVAEGSDGALWIGYYEEFGVSRIRYAGGRIAVEHFTRKNGLRSDGVVSLGSDSRGWIWVGTDAGADVFDGRTWRHYGQASGLIWDDCDGSSFLSEPGGDVWIGTSRGLSHFLPKRIEANRQPPVAITEISAGGTALDPVARAVIGYRDRSVRIGFAGLSFRNEGGLRFHYRLEGFEQAWADTEQGEARYPKLPPGDYTFRVTAVTSHGVWSPAPATFSFRVLPPWWRTWWALSLLAGICGLAVWGLWRRRMQQVFGRQRMLERVVAERTREIERLLDETKQASRSKSEFLATMSHEIRTPLNGLLGMTDLALGTRLDEEQREYLQTARNSGATLLALLNDILDLSKIEAGRLDFDPVPFSVRDCAAQVRDTLAPEARRQGLSLRCEVDPAVPSLLLGDPVRFRQVLLNITGNAVKFTSVGSVRIHVAADAGASGRVTLHVTVTDTGIGIAPEKLRVIFEPFRQADGSTTRKFGGTGLGLAISSRLVEMMGGRIWVESQPGAGSAFHFTAALQPAPSDSPANPRVDGVSPLETGPLEILLAEDNPVNQRLALRLLQKRGHTVTVANNGREALEAWEKGRFDLVMLDVQMPEMDGLEAAEAIRAHERETGGRVPLLALTAYAMKGDREACLAAGMDEYISKPIDSDELFRKIALLVQPPAGAAEGCGNEAFGPGVTGPARS